MSTQPTRSLETFPNPKPDRRYIITCECPEFTCLCPRTGQPDFATVIVQYTPDQLCFELKSFKLYIWSFRNEGKFHEAVCNQICDDVVTAIKPRWLEVTMRFTVRGGITTTVVARHGDYSLAPAIHSAKPSVLLRGPAKLGLARRTLTKVRGTA